MTKLCPIFTSHVVDDKMESMQGSSLIFSLAGQSGQPKSGLAGPQLVWLARDTFICFGQPIIITIYYETETESQRIFVI